MATNRPFVRDCPCCGGTGKVELTGVYMDTFHLTPKAGEFTAADLSREVSEDVNATAMSNRLARLEQLGLLTSRQYGRKRLYKRA